MQNDVLNELGTNFIEYAVAVNTDRAIPNAHDGLKPVAKRILYGAFDQGFSSDKPHVKCANIVGNVMADWHPHGDSSIYGALVRLSQNWVMRYPLIDFHGSNGNIDGDGPAAYRYTEARIGKLTEDGLLCGIKKDNVDFIPNYSETKDEPTELPSIFPNLLCNPNNGIGVAMACNWAPHNLKEVAQAINDYIAGREPMLPGPDFPTGGVVINKDAIPEIMRTGRGSVRIRGKYHMEDENIVFTEIPYGASTESIMQQVGKACDEDKIHGVDGIRNESDKKGYRLVIECEKNAPIQTILNKLFAETDLQTSFAYNQVALVDKTPTELNLKDCIKIYVEYNNKCIVRECEFDIKKATERLHIIVGLLKALDIIDDIIKMIKSSESAQVAKQSLMDKWGFSEVQAQAILDMKLSRLSHLEKVDLENEQKELNALLGKLNEICLNPTMELQNRLSVIVAKYGDDRRTELTQIDIKQKQDRELEFVEPEKCVVTMTESGLVKKIPSIAFKMQKKNGKGIKSTNDIVSNIIRTNTVDHLLIFTDKGKMYRLLVNNIPTGTNTSLGTPIKTLVPMEKDEKPTIIYSIYKDTDANYIIFVTKEGLIKKGEISEYVKIRKNIGTPSIKIRPEDELVSINLIKDENMLLITKNGYCIRIDTKEVGVSSRAAMGIKGMGLRDGDEVVTALPIRHDDDYVGVFSTNGFAKKTKVSEYNVQARGGKGTIIYKPTETTGDIVECALISDEDSILAIGDKNSICISAADITSGSRSAVGTKIIKNSNINSVSKV